MILRIYHCDSLKFAEHVEGLHEPTSEVCNGWQGFVIYKEKCSSTEHLLAPIPPPLAGKYLLPTM